MSTRPRIVINTIRLGDVQVDDIIEFPGRGHRSPKWRAVKAVEHLDETTRVWDAEDGPELSKQGKHIRTTHCDYSTALVSVQEEVR